jgi:putative ABC transport system permease protein
LSSFDQRLFPPVANLWRYLQYGIRTLARSPGFAAGAVAILALGIGCSSTIFSVANAVLFRPLPFAHPDELVSVFERTSRGNREGVAPATFLDWRAQNRSFSTLATSRGLDVNLTGSGEPEQLGGAAVSEGMFQMLGAAPASGRGFQAEDYGQGAPGVVILSHGFWQRRFGGRDVLGKNILLGGKPYDVAGIMPRNFWFFWGRMDVWLPLRFTNQDLASRSGRARLMTIGRLRPGTSRAQAQGEMAALSTNLEASHPEAKGWSVTVRPLREQDEMVRHARPALLLLLAAVGIVMLIVCANMANLLLLRGGARAREIAVRSALGARRGALIGQFLVESLVLSCAGGLVGVLVSKWGIQLASTLIPEDLRLSLPAGPEQLGINAEVLWFNLAVCLMTGLLFGIAPAWQLSRPNLCESLKEGGRVATDGPVRRRLRRVLASAEIALSLVLLITAALILQSYLRMYHRDLGYRPEGVQAMLLLNLTAPAAGEILKKVEAIPGVQAAAFASPLPGWPVVWPFDFRQVEIERASGEPPVRALQTYVRGPYLDTMGFTLLRGRGFTAEEYAGERHVAIVNREFAKRYGLWPDPAGKRFRGAGSPAAPWLTIVGMVEDERHPLTGDPMPAFYRPGVAEPPPYLLYRARVDVTQTVRDRIWSVNAGQPVLALGAMDKIVGEARSPVRFGLALICSFAALALMVAAVGLYAVVAYGASSRAHEIGVRMALGATARDIRKLVLGEALGLALTGVAAGVLAALAASRILARFLYGFSATDPLTFAGVAAFLLIVATGAAWQPARKAAAADPMVSLRSD